MDESTQSRERKCQCRIDCVGVVENVVAGGEKVSNKSQGKASHSFISRIVGGFDKGQEEEERAAKDGGRECQLQLRRGTVTWRSGPTFEDWDVPLVVGQRWTLIDKDPGFGGIDDDSGDETIDSGRGIEGTVVYGYGDLVHAGST